MIWRFILTVFVILSAFVLRTFNTAAATLVTGNLAGLQFDNSNVSYFGAQTMNWFSGTGGWITMALIAVLAMIWVKPLKNLIIPVAMILAILVGTIVPAHAYYDQTDWAEVDMILPNESAFWIPEVGANMNSQVKFGSEEYYAHDKIAAKRFVIPHTKLENSGRWSNYYVPSGRLIVVDRTPYTREWTSDSNRGTSKKDQAFRCQSSEGLNIISEVSIATSVEEDNAAKFLYFFGVNNPKCDRAQPECVFTSVYYGKSLSEVMDNVGRGLVQTAVCDELSKHTLDMDNQQSSTIMQVVGKNAAIFLNSRGITLNYIGWAGTFTFDSAVQDAINKRYVSTTVAAGMPVLENLANVKVKEGLGAGLEKHGLPSNWLIMPANLDFSSLFNAGRALGQK